MKQLFLFSFFVVAACTALGQHVGIGEPNPTVKLTVRGTGYDPNLLVKNGNNDSVMLVNYNNVRVGGVHDGILGVLSISNKHFGTTDPPHLELIAHGEPDAVASNGSLNIIKFRKANSNKYYQLQSYVGSDVSRHGLGITYFDPDDGTGSSKYLMRFDQRRYLGIATHIPEGRLQINHYATTTNPTLRLMDSSATAGPIIHFGRTTTGLQYWQMRSIIGTSAGNCFFDFATTAGVAMTIRGDGYLGVGNFNPAERLDVQGNAKIRGELQGPNTGSANLMPICYGQVAAAGSISNGSGNFTVSRSSVGVYTITISGENFLYTNYTTVVTPATSSPIVAVAGSGGGNLQVRTYNLSGAATDASFSFVVYKQ